MSYIPKQLRQARERIETKLDRELIGRLELYCQYLESDRDYVIAKALEIAFQKDKGFAEWLKTQPAGAARTRPDEMPGAQAGMGGFRRRTSSGSEPAAENFRLTPPQSAGTELPRR